MPTQYLVLTDVDAIQRFVFSSARMAAIVGASAIVRQFDNTLRDLAKTTYRALPAVVSGGNGLFVFSEQAQADAFRIQAAREFRRASVNGSLTASAPIAFKDDAGYPAALQRALDDLDMAKRLGTAQAEPVGLGLARQCEFCGSEPAQPKPRTVGTDRRYIGAACAAKLDARDVARAASAGDSPARDFNDLAGEDYLAIIVIDGDGLGDRLKRIATVDRYEAFSENVKRVVGAALEAGFARLRSSQGGEGQVGAFEPFQPLYHGGDDIVLACQARWAFPFVEAFSRELEAEDWNWAGTPGRIGFSVGVTIAQSGFPFRIAHRIAEELLRNAKRAAKGEPWQEGAIDFAIVTEASGDAETLLAERKICCRGKTEISLTGRPYRLASRETRSLCQLRDACAELKDFPRGRLFDLRNALTASAWSKTGDETAFEVQSIKEGLNAYRQQWESRVTRIPERENAWKRACGKLPIDDQTYPYSDLADALYLWETSLGNLDSADH